MILGIDYGLKNIGLETSEGSIAEPLKVVHSLVEIKKIVKDLKIEKIIVGISEGKSRTLAEEFGNNLKNVLGLPIEFVDETLTSHEAAMPAGRQGRKNHAKAAAFILQRYLDK